ncbi:hypothetical protein [Pantoea stewartii]|uniref:hypothetical protein n=1 Tax=Pantoea stewartii TaxID=66269 RepID=UPI00197F9F21|nr:hypothetical protein [Pantoea stewartii]
MSEDLKKCVELKRVCLQNDADTLYRGYIMNLMLSWTNTKLPLMFRDDVISLAGPYPFRGVWQDRRKRKRFPGQK